MAAASKYDERCVVRKSGERGRSDVAKSDPLAGIERLTGFRGDSRWLM
jgi:hypothetical protein